MDRRVLIPVAALLVTLLTAFGVWLFFPPESPRVAPERNTNETANDTNDEPEPPDVNPDDFKPGAQTPDPVRSERPQQPFETTVQTRRFIVAGRVVTESGVGVERARVTFHGEQKLRDWRASGVTDDAGYYRMLAWALSARSTVANDSFGLIAVETAEGAIAVGGRTAIPDDPEVNMPDVVVREHHTIEGQVLTDQGLPAAGAEVTARSSGRVEVATLRGRAPSVSTRPLATTVTADDSGRFRFANLPPAEYGLTATAGYLGNQNQMVTVDVRNTHSAWQDINLTLTNYVRGTLVDQAGQPVPGAAVQLRRVTTPAGATDDSGETKTNASGELKIATSREMRDSIRRFDDEARLQAVGRTIAVTDAAGRFGFLNRGEGEYELVTRVGESEARLKGVQINQPDYRLEVDVSTLIAGVVRDAETGLPVERFDVRVLPGEGDPRVDPFERVNREGRFAWHARGEYMIPNPTVQAMRIRVSAPGFAPGVVSVSDLQTGDARRGVDVSLKPLCDLSVRLTLDGLALDLEPVALLFDDRLAYSGSTNEIGLARLIDVAPQSYRVRLIRADGTRLEGDLVVPARREATLEVKLEPAE